MKPRALSAPRGAVLLLAVVIFTNAARAGTFSTAAWTDDASTRIASQRTLWAYHFGAATTATVNGISVPGLPGPNVAGDDFDLTGTASVFNGDTNHVTGTGSTVMASGFVYDGDPATVTLKGLTVGRNYVVSFFSIGWQGDSGDVDFRNVTFSSAADSQLVKQDQFGVDNGIRIDYAFTAVTTTRSITIAVANPNSATFHLYALALNQPPFVSNNNDSGTGSLRQAIVKAAAFPGADTVTFDTALFLQTITLGSEIVINDTTGPVTVDASTLAAPVTIDGGAGMNRLFSVSAGKNLALINLTLTGGNGEGDAQNGNGGAIANFGTLVLTRCTLTGNSRDDRSGGAILNDGGTLTLTQCTLSGNSAINGGAIFQKTGSLVLSQCTLSGNSAVINGAGDGGAIFKQHGSLTATYCTFSGNRADATDGVGGAIRDEDGTTTLTHCTLARNHAADSGAGFYQAGGSLTLTNTIIAENTAISVFPDISQENGTITPTGVNFIGDPNGSDLSASDTIFTTYANGPINLAPLGNYGGPTQTMGLRPGSPARNAATGSAITSDQRDFPIVGPPDIGAYEAGTLNINFNAFIWETLPANATDEQHLADFDFDGDGQTNYNEWVALTNPGDPASYLRVTQLVRIVDGLQFTFPSVLGRNYTLDYSFDLVTWTPDSGVFPGTDNPITLQYHVSPDAQRFFFRVGVGP